MGFSLFRRNRNKKGDEVVPEMWTTTSQQKLALYSIDKIPSSVKKQ